MAASQINAYSSIRSAWQFYRQRQMNRDGFLIDRLKCAFTGMWTWIHVYARYFRNFLRSSGG